MITPEFINEEQKQYIFVANHSLESNEAIKMSIAFHLARIKFAREHLPTFLSKCILIYDVRGQNIAIETRDYLRNVFSEIDELRFFEG